MSHMNIFKDDGEESGILGDDDHKEINKLLSCITSMSRLCLWMAERG